MKKYIFAAIVIASITLPAVNTIPPQDEENKSHFIVKAGTDPQLFADNYIIEQLSGGAQLRLHHPEPREVAILHDEPWEGSNCHYHSIFRDGNIFRMYYRGMQIGNKDNPAAAPHPPVFCYAESTDGINWTKPELGIYDFEGSRNNNIILAERDFGDFHFVPGDNAAMFKDSNPAVTPGEQYKALVHVPRLKGLVAFKSPDGINWTPLKQEPVITDGAFDSQNIAFWDKENDRYRAYWRYFTNESPENRYSGTRSIRTATSEDFIHWENTTNLTFPGSPEEQLYTNQIIPYFRAPKIFIGFPTRYIDRGWSESMRLLPESQHRILRSKVNQRYGTALTEGLFMMSRDGVAFTRWNEAFLRPGIEREGTWNYGQQFIAWGILETKSDLEGAPNEISLYATENGWTGNSNILRRYTLRIDGFVSVYAPLSGGELITKKMIFEGNELLLNLSSSAAGDITVEILDENGKPLDGYTRDDCPPVFGDSLEKKVYWTKGSDLSQLKGRPVQLKFYIRDADLYSFRFNM